MPTAVNCFSDNDTVLNLSPENRVVWNEMFACRSEIEKILGCTFIRFGNDFWRFNSDITIASYLLARASQEASPKEVTLETLCATVSQEISFAADRLNSCWNSLLALTDKYDENIFLLNAILQNNDNPAKTPECITKIAKDLLTLQPGEEIADFCCGSGSALASFAEKADGIKGFGFDMDSYAIAIAQVNAEIKKLPLLYEKSDVFQLWGAQAHSFNKIFSNYPFGVRLNDLANGKEYLKELTGRIPSMSKATSSDWLYNMLMIDNLAESGKAIGIMTNGSTWNRIDTPIRKYFVENGLVESVIALPAKLFNNTSIPVSMIILSHRNHSVRLVDATEQYEAGRRQNEMTAKNIEAVLNALRDDSDHSFNVSLEELRENDYVLHPSRYGHQEKESPNGLPFGAVIKRITRGAPLTAEQLDNLSSVLPTNMQYLMLANIHNGLIDKELPYLKNVDEKYEKYCLSNRCLILSKNGYPYKIAVAEINNKQKVLANGNLYIIELDEQKADPYYVAAYLSSEEGTAALKSITVGASIPNIGVEQLRKLNIPIPPLEKQMVLASRYQTAQDEIELLQIKLEKAKSRLAHVFDEEE